MTIGRAVRNLVGRLARDERGMLTAHNLLLTISCCAIGAAALDVTSFYQARTHLQVAADVGAHAALFTRYRGRNDTDAKTAAVGAATYGMPSSYGTVLAASNITFGTFNAGTSSFTALPAGSTAMPSAVQVVTDRAGDNPVGSFLFRIVGISKMDVSASATYTTYYDQCETDGLMAQGVVDIESMNAFFRGFCVHSNDYVSASQNNSFELGTIVSMPDKTRLDIPNSGFEKNPGLEQALRNGSYDLTTELNRLRPSPFVQAQGIENYYTALSRPYNAQTAPYSPDYITSSTAIPHDPGTYTADDFAEGRVHTINNCTTSGPSSTLTLRAGTRPYRNVVIFTNCNIQFDGDVLMTNAVVSTTSTDDKSIKTPSGNNNGLQLGVDDDCAQGGGAQLLTMGGMDSAAKLTLYGGQIRALKDVQFAAQIEGEGVSVMTMGRILGNSKGSLYGCGGKGMDPDFQPTRFRLAL
jgi:hypothetical protein